MADIKVEGWRFLPHSFATVNQFQCLEFLKRSYIKLYHHDVPYWNPGWRPVSGLFEKAQEIIMAPLQRRQLSDIVGPGLRMSGDLLMQTLFELPYFLHSMPLQ